jgi:hypothetical protein
MSENTSDDDLPGLVLDKIEIQNLADEVRQYRQEQRQTDDSDADEDEDDDDAIPISMERNCQEFSKLAERYRASCSRPARAALLRNATTLWKTLRRRRTRSGAHAPASNEPDGDGFATVSYSAKSVASELEQSVQQRWIRGEKTRARREAARRKKTDRVAGGLYRFQTKEHRAVPSGTARRFEEDLAKVKR